jgi:XXXCH domain-containing protein
MGSKGQKIETYLTLEELPEFFRDFARRMEVALDERNKGRPNELSAFRSIKIRIKQSGPEVAVKIKVKGEISGDKEPAAVSPEFAEPETISYKQLKKRMDKTFGDLSRSLREGFIPTAANVDRFHCDARHMVTYEDKGKPYYDEFTKAAHGFLDACRKGDVTVAQAGCRRLADLKKACHDRFK